MTLVRWQCVLDLQAHTADYGFLHNAFSRVRMPQDVCVILPLGGFGRFNMLIEKFVLVYPSGAAGTPQAISCQLPSTARDSMEFLDIIIQGGASRVAGFRKAHGAFSVGVRPNAC
jgi:hypothetical protein